MLGEPGSGGSLQDYFSYGNFSYGNRFPVEVSGRRRTNRNNPMYIAHEILRLLHPGAPGEQNAVRDGELISTVPQFRYNPATLANLLPNQTVQGSISDIIKSAKEAIKRPKKDQYGISCADLFSGKGLEFLEAYEKSIGKDGALRFGEKNADGIKFTVDHYGNTSQKKTAKVGNQNYSVITFNTTSSLYNSDTFGFSEGLKDRFGHLSFTDFWAAALLHEIGHAIRNRYGANSETPGLIDPDGLDAPRSLANQSFVVENCFPKP